MKKWKKITLGIIGVGAVCAIVPACVISCSSIYNTSSIENSTATQRGINYEAGMDIWQDVIQSPIVPSSNGWTIDSAKTYFKNGVTDLVNKNGWSEVLTNVLPVNMIVEGLDSAQLGFSNENFTNPYFEISTYFNLKNFSVIVNSDNTFTIKAIVTYTITDKNDKGTLSFTNNYEWDNVKISDTLSKVGNCYYGTLLLSNSTNGLELSPNSSFLNDVSVSSAFSPSDFAMLCNDCQWLPRPANINQSDSVTNQLSQIKKIYQQALTLNNKNHNISFSSNNLLLSNWFLTQNQVFCFENIYNFGYINSSYLSNPIYDDANDSYNWSYNDALNNYQSNLKNVNDYSSLINNALQQAFSGYSNNQLIKADDSTINSWHLIASNYQDNTLTYDIQVKITSYPKGVNKPLTASFDMDFKESNIMITPTLIPISSDLTSNPAGYGGYTWANSNDATLTITFSDFTRSSGWTNHLSLITFNNILSPLQTNWNSTWNNSIITNTYSLSQIKANQANDPANSLYLLSMVNTNSNNLYYYNSISNWNTDQGMWYYVNVINYV